MKHKDVIIIIVLICLGIAANHSIEQVRKESLGKARPHLNLGLAYLVANDDTAAFRQFQRALSIDPDMYEAHNNLGLTYAHMGYIDKAVEHLEIANSLRPVGMADDQWEHITNNLNQAKAMQKW